MSLSSLSKEPATREKILDATARRIEAVGFSNTTLTSVAKAAHLSRMTIYRHYASIEEVMQDLMTREFNGIIEHAVFDSPGQLDSIERRQLVEAVTSALDQLTRHPLFLRLLAADPELLLPYVTERPGRFQLRAQAVLEAAIKAAIEADQVEDDDPERLAGSMILAMRGYALTDKSRWSKRERAAMLSDLATMLDALLAPKGSS